MPRWLARILIGAAIVASLLALGTVAAWGVDRVVHTDQINRNVTFAGIPVGGMSEAEFAAVLDGVSAETADSRVVVAAPGLDIVVTGAEAGITLDRDAALDEVFAAGRTGSPIDSLTTWLDGMGNPYDVAPTFRIDIDATAEMIRSAPGWVKLGSTGACFAGRGSIRLRL